MNKLITSISLTLCIVGASANALILRHDPSAPLACWSLAFALLGILVWFVGRFNLLSRGARQLARTFRAVADLLD